MPTFTADNWPVTYKHEGSTLVEIEVDIEVEYDLDGSDIDIDAIDVTIDGQPISGSLRDFIVGELERDSALFEQLHEQADDIRSDGYSDYHYDMRYGS